MKWLEKYFFLFMLVIAFVGVVLANYLSYQNHKPVTVENKQVNVVLTDDKTINFLAEKFVEYDNKLVIYTKSTVKKDEAGKAILDNEGFPVLIPAEVVTLPMTAIKGYTYLK